ncbi:hypothetical protein FNZ56_01280 [Pseudoluteimonas lycopersici]|uniref:YbbD head domain-containing protein n=2 Tax=Pseudoluteimonas lycopersici TaxID=1324796 RepID=A0A516V253_9GAMM|nr:hypothetical protein FNZ56_01280 [Lysobacter lycopersici]
MDRFRRIALVASAAAVACSCSTSDVLDASYATRADAVAAGAIERGWIPAWVPVEATQLREVHDSDTNESALSFSLPSNLAWEPSASCRPADGGEFPEPAFRRTWLPDNYQRYAFYSCPSGTTGSVPMIAAIAVTQDKKRVLYWRVLSR